MDALLPRDSEVRAFVTSAETAAALRSRGVKVALGDVSDGSHVGGAALNAFCAVLIHSAATDDRERSFADDAAEVLAAWVEGLNEAAIKRVVVAWDDPPADVLSAIEAPTAIVSVTGRPTADVAAEIAELEDVAQLP